MLSPTAAWKRAFDQKDVKPVVLFILEFPSSVTYKAIKGYSSDATVGSYPGSLAAVSPVSGAMDVIDRKSKVSSVTLQFQNDGWMKNLVINNYLKGRKVSLKLGAQDLAESDFLEWFAGTVDEEPIPRANGIVELKVASALSLLRDRDILGYWVNLHPAQVIADILSKAGVPTSLYNSTSLDPTQSQYSDISHFCVQRGGGLGTDYYDNAIREPTSALKLIDEICQMLDGQFIERENGELTFKVFDKTASAVAAWTHDDFDHESFEIVETDKNLMNQVAISFTKMTGGQYQHKYTRDDTASQSDHAFPDGTARVVSKHYEVDWLDGIGIITQSDTVRSALTASLPAANSTARTAGHSTFGWCGSRWPGFPSGSQPSSAKPTTSRLVYIKTGDEMIAMKDIIVHGDNNSDNIKDPATGALVSLSLPYALEYTVSARGALGTTPAAHPKNDAAHIAADATIAVYMAQKRIERFSYGAPVIKLKTNLRKFDIQLGDLVTVTTDKYFCKGTSSLDTNTKWEVIGKDVVIEGGDVGIVWTLCWATHTSPPTPTIVSATTAAFHQATSVAHTNQALTQLAFNNSVSGMTASKSGLTLTIAEGTYGSGAKTMPKASKSFTCTVSKDTYVYINSLTGAWVTKEVTVAASEPTREPGLISIVRATTNGSAITTLLDMRNQEVFVGQKIVVSSIKPLAVSSTAVLSTSLNLNSTFSSFTKG